MTKSKKVKGVMKQSHERCKGCGFCVRECPAGALSFSDSVNRKGYQTIDMDMEKCTSCAICYTVCPDYVFERVEVN